MASDTNPQMQAKVQISGTLAWHDKDGNVIGTTDFTMTKPLAELIGPNTEKEHSNDDSCHQ
jgi:hypothetical protein